MARQRTRRYLRQGGLCLPGRQFDPNLPIPDYLLYGRYYIPTSCLDALYATRLSPTLQALVSIMLDPANGPLYVRHSKGCAGLSGANNVMIYLQHDDISAA